MPLPVSAAARELAAAAPEPAVPMTADAALMLVSASGAVAGAAEARDDLPVDFPEDAERLDMGNSLVEEKQRPVKCSQGLMLQGRKVQLKWLHCGLGGPHWGRYGQTGARLVGVVLCGLAYLTQAQKVWSAPNRRMPFLVLVG